MRTSHSDVTRHLSRFLKICPCFHPLHVLVSTRRHQYILNLKCFTVNIFGLTTHVVIVLLSECPSASNTAEVFKGVHCSSVSTLKPPSQAAKRPYPAEQRCSPPGFSGRCLAESAAARSACACSKSKKNKTHSHGGELK